MAQTKTHHHDTFFLMTPPPVFELHENEWSVRMKIWNWYLFWFFLLIRFYSMIFSITFALAFLQSRFAFIQLYSLFVFLPTKKKIFFLNKF